MTRRSATTLTIQLTLRIPPGSNAGQVLDFIKRALLNHKERVNAFDPGSFETVPKPPISAIDLDSLAMKLAKRETTYL